MVKRAATKRTAKHCYEWPRPSVTADVALLRLGHAKGKPSIEVLLIRRGRPPFEGCWALPGGFVDRDEDLPVAALRELAEETGVSGARLEQVGVIGTPGRDPRGHTVTALYVAGVREGQAMVVAGDDAAEARWFDTAKLPRLAFDHGELMTWTMLHTRDRLGRSRMPFDLLPERFGRDDAARLWLAIHRRRDGFDAAWRAWLAARAIVATPAGKRYRVDARALARLDPLASRAGR